MEWLKGFRGRVRFRRVGEEGKSGIWHLGLKSMIVGGHYENDLSGGPPSLSSPFSLFSLSLPLSLSSPLSRRPHPRLPHPTPDVRREREREGESRVRVGWGGAGLSRVGGRGPGREREERKREKGEEKGPVVGGPEVGHREREEKRKKGEERGKERERGVASDQPAGGEGAGGGSPVSGVGRRRPSPTSKRSRAMEKTLDGKGNVR
ncbi:hypothetical protein TIFTF001_036854 [Ficus carica]|uniref:Uncharacterized protein n=1 Tax=Ficus carica TaxID=3494 RepID=A0AA88JB96_FICCA|nr:hypothetical protein TIFTF001_036854 [Ficus carica]